MDKGERAVPSTSGRNLVARLKGKGLNNKGCRKRLVRSLLLVLLMSPALAVPARAAEFKSGDTPGVPAGVTIDDDLYLAGGDSVILGDVTRDVLAATANLEVRGRIDGNLIAATNDVNLYGPIGRSVRIAGNNVHVHGPIGGDLVALSGSVIIEPQGSVAGDVVAAGDVVVQGRVNGDVRASGTEVRINAPVGGSVQANAPDIVIGPGARITGELAYRADTTPIIDPAAVITGPTLGREFDEELFGGFGDGIGRVGFFLVRWLMGLIAGLVIVLLAPGAAVSVAESARNRPWPAFLLGLALLIGVPLALALLGATLIGLPIALIGLAAYLAAIYLSQVFVGLAIGRFLLPSRWGDEGRGFNLLAMTVGVTIFAGLRLTPIRFADPTIAALTAIVGLGALVIGLRRNRPHRPRAFTPTAPARV